VHPQSHPRLSSFPMQDPLLLSTCYHCEQAAFCLLHALPCQPELVSPLSSLYMSELLFTFIYFKALRLPQLSTVFVSAASFATILVNLTRAFVLLAALPPWSQCWGCTSHSQSLYVTLSVPLCHSRLLQVHAYHVLPACLTRSALPLILL
jgi:hypothetical protein